MPPGDTVRIKVHSYLLKCTVKRKIIRTLKLILQYCTWLLDGFEEACRHNYSILWKWSGLKTKEKGNMLGPADSWDRVVVLNAFLKTFFVPGREY